MASNLTQASRIYVTGHRGLAGSAIVARLQLAGFDNILTVSHAELDLRDQAAVNRFFAMTKPDYVIHAAGKVGGIGANVAEPVDFAYDNLLMQATVLRAAWQSHAKKLLYLGSSCVYPRDCPQPMREEFLLTGPLEQTNEGYALAKIMGVKSCQYYRRQFGCNFIAALPTNLYGPGDKFDPERSHVVPALIRKFHEAKLSGINQVTLWGTGSPLRELLHVDDLADACLYLLQNYDQPEPINIGTGEEVSIAELAHLIRDVVYPTAVINFDTGKPDGTQRKLVDVTKLHHLGWRHQYHLREGLAKTYDWFVTNLEAQAKP